MTSAATVRLSNLRAISSSISLTHWWPPYNSGMAISHTTKKQLEKRPRKVNFDTALKQIGPQNRPARPG